MKKTTLMLIALFFATMVIGIAQTVSIDFSTQRYLGDVSDLDRTKYFNLHSGNSTDADLVQFYNDYNVGRGRGFWGAFSVAKNQEGAAGVYPALTGGDGQVRTVTPGHVATEHPGSAFINGISATAAGAWAADYYRNEANPPEFFEPMNEPFVHTGDFGTDNQNIKTQMSQLFNEVGKAIHAAPELANMKVVGYSSAWPSMELWDFGHWEQNQKLFMDIAGANMDAFSTHLYDGLNVTGQDNSRSGSNGEAILDLIEAYSYIKWGTVKPHAITEYGGIASGYSSNYTELEAIQSIRSINNILFNLLEREDKMEISIPFITDKSTWHLTAANNYQPYGAVLLKPTNIGEATPAGWEYSSKVLFYELWKEVEGKRVAISSDNPDIQVQAFVNGTKMYVAINNLSTTSESVSLNYASGISGLQNVKIKSLTVHQNQTQDYSDVTQTSAPGSVSMAVGETKVLEYTFQNAISFSNAIRSTRYYSNTYLQPITANTALSFAINGVTTGSGKATLKMSIGRKHDVSKSPIVKINGTTVAVPNNWKGNDQSNRTDFFGMIDIPFDMSLLQANNTISIQFPDAGGHVASVILQAEKYDSEPVTGQAPYGGANRAIPGTIEAEEFDEGGSGVAYYDTDASNNGANVMREDEGVDIEARDGGNSVGWTANGEWMEYTTNVASGTYTIEARLASTQTGKTLVAKLDGLTLGTFTVPNTGDWGVFQTVSLTDIVINGGNDKILRLEFVGGSTNINWVKFTKTADPVVELVSCDQLPTSIESTTSYTVTIPYVASQSRDVCVELWNTTWLAQGTTTVPSGSGTASVTIPISSAPAAGAGYSFKTSLRPVDSTWESNITSCTKTNVSVTVVIPTYTLTATSIGQGSVTMSPAGGTYDQGTIVMLTAAPIAGNQFDSWSGDASGTSATTTVTMTANKSVTANFSVIPSTQSPYGGINRTIPGTIEAEEFDEGGEGIAYHDTDATNAGPNIMRETEGVDIESRDGGNSVGWTANGEWLEYTVNTTGGTYNIEARLAATSTGKKVNVLIDGTQIASIAVPNTGDWGTFQTVTIENVPLATNSNRILRLEFDGGSTNINWVKFSAAGPTNLLSNWDFEAGDLTSWSSWGGVSVVANNQHGGSYAVTVNGAGAPSQVVNVSPSTTYTFSAWGKVAASGQFVYLGVKGHDASESSTTLNTTTYSEVSHTFTTGANATTAQVYFYCPNASYQVWGDDFELIAGTKSAIVEETILEKASMKVYPNPVSGNEFTIELNGVAGQSLVTILDISGRIVYNQIHNEKEIHASKESLINKGVYILVVKNQNATLTQKIIIE